MSDLLQQERVPCHRLRWQLQSLGLLICFLASGYTPPPERKDVQTTRASGTRGCPVPLGELSLIGKDLKTQQSRPNLLFWVSPQPTAPPPLLLVVVKNRDAKPIFEKKVEVRRAGYLFLPVQTELAAGENYRVVAGLLCQGSTQNAAILETSLTRVEKMTDWDKTIEELLATHEIPREMAPR